MSSCQDVLAQVGPASSDTTHVPSAMHCSGRAVWTPAPLSSCQTCLHVLVDERARGVQAVSVVATFMPLRMHCHRRTLQSSAHSMPIITFIPLAVDLAATVMNVPVHEKPSRSFHVDGLTMTTHDPSIPRSARSTGQSHIS